MVVRRIHEVQIRELGRSQVEPWERAGERVEGTRVIFPAERHLPLEAKADTFGTMSTVAEIESAIERLPMEQVREVAAWLEEYQATINASSEVFAMLDAEEGEGDQWHDPK